MQDVVKTDAAETSSGGQMITIYGIANCDTVRRARRELSVAAAESGHTVTFIDWRTRPVERSRIHTWIERCGNALINPRSRGFLALDAGAQRETLDQTMDPATIERLRGDPTLMRRPLIEFPDGRIGLGWQKGQPKTFFASPNRA